MQENVSGIHDKVQNSDRVRLFDITICLFTVPYVYVNEYGGKLSRTVLDYKETRFLVVAGS